MYQRTLAQYHPTLSLAQLADDRTNRYAKKHYRNSTHRFATATTVCAGDLSCRRDDDQGYLCKTLSKFCSSICDSNYLPFAIARNFSCRFSTWDSTDCCSSLTITKSQSFILILSSTWLLIRASASSRVIPSRCIAR